MSLCAGAPAGKEHNSNQTRAQLQPWL